MNFKECLDEIRKENLKSEKLRNEATNAILKKLIEGLKGEEIAEVKVVDDEDGKGFVFTGKSETPFSEETWEVRFRSDEYDDEGEPDINESEPEKEDEPIDCGGGLFAAGEPKEDPNKVFGIFARIDEPRREDYETREAFEADHEKYDRAVEAITACDWKNKSDDAPLHKVNAIRKEVGEMPPLNVNLVGETHWFDDWAKEHVNEGRCWCGEEHSREEKCRCDKEHVSEGKCWCGEEHAREDKCCCDKEHVSEGKCWCGEEHSRKEKCCDDKECDSDKAENIEKLMKQVAETIGELVKDPDALAALFKYTKNLL